MVDYGDNRFVTLLYGDDHFVTLLYGDTWFTTLLYGNSWFLYCTMYLTDLRCHLAPPALQIPFLSLSHHPFFPPHQLSPLLSPLSPSISCSPFDIILSCCPLYTQEWQQRLSSIASNVIHLAAQRLPHRSWSRSSAPPSIDLWHDIIAILAPLQNAMNHSPHPCLTSMHGPV
ncbi:hypothetical protein F5148DRAFT_1183293 [Russula earlei]|uniref:Uncharacterized protein n=1 Tax=Russula earlei TaxID=71964 RepID=A0ACC0UFU6_9AGAM|nr:hypothetical protein F5148DRAFT_1183293 [Russula earlei]